MDISLIAFLGLFLGVLARMMLPYWRKALAGEPITFQMRYLGIMLGSLLTAWQVFPSYIPVLDSLFVTLWSAITFGFGLQSLYTEGYAWIEDAVEKTLKKP